MDMASEEHEERRISFAVPSDIGDWLTEQADSRGESKEDVVKRLLVASHAVTRNGQFDDYADREDLAELRGHIETQREEFVELVEDVRSRIVQVKRETDTKAPEDHAHDEYATEDDLEAVRSGLHALENAHGSLETTVDTGFENFEGILDHLVSESEKLEERSTILAREIVSLREKRRILAERERRRAEVDRLKLAANRSGIRKATCEECGSSVDVALLTEPECPHCASSIADIRKKSSIFGSHTLEVGHPPELEGRVVDAVEGGSTDGLEWADIDGEETG